MKKRAPKKMPMPPKKPVRMAAARMPSEGMPVDRMEPKGMPEGSRAEESFDERQMARKSGPRVI